MRLKDKVSVITGASQGIGYAVAKMFGNEGAKIIIADLNEESGLEAEKALQESGIEAFL